MYSVTLPSCYVWLSLHRHFFCWSNWMMPKRKGENYSFIRHIASLQHKVEWTNPDFNEHNKKKWLYEIIIKNNINDYVMNNWIRWLKIFLFLLSSMDEPYGWGTPAKQKKSNRLSWKTPVFDCCEFQCTVVFFSPLSCWATNKKGLMSNSVAMSCLKQFRRILRRHFAISFLVISLFHSTSSSHFSS